MYDLKAVFYLLKALENTDKKEVVKELYDKFINVKRTLLNDAVFDEMIKQDYSWKTEVMPSEYFRRRFHDLNTKSMEQLQQIVDSIAGLLVTLED
jgi:hypothetical protein